MTTPDTSTAPHTLTGVKWLLLVLCCLLSATTFATNEQPVVVAVDQGNPPFMYSGRNLQAKGLYPTLIRAIFERIHQPVKVIAIPWKRALRGLDNNWNAVGGIYKTTERLRRYDYTMPLFTEELHVFVRADSKLQFHQISDLNGLYISVLRGWSYGDAFDQARARHRFDTIAADNETTGLRLLLLRRVDAYVGIDLSAERTLDTLQVRDRVKALPVPLATNDTYIAFAKIAHQQALIERINAAIRALRDDGTFQALIQQAIVSKKR